MKETLFIGLLLIVVTAHAQAPGFQGYKGNNDNAAFLIDSANGEKFYKITELDCYTMSDLYVSIPYDDLLKSYTKLSWSVDVFANYGEFVKIAESGNIPDNMTDLLDGLFTQFQSTTVEFVPGALSQFSNAIPGQLVLPLQQQETQFQRYGQDPQQQITFLNLKYPPDPDLQGKSLYLVWNLTGEYEDGSSTTFEVSTTSHETSGGGDNNDLNTDYTNPPTTRSTYQTTKGMHKDAIYSIAIILNNQEFGVAKPDHITELGCIQPGTLFYTKEPVAIITTNPAAAKYLQPLNKTINGYFEEKTPDGKEIYRAGYKSLDGRYHGEIREYNEGKLESIMVFTNGLENGLFVLYDTEGNIKWQGHYKNGKKDGTWKHYVDGILEESIEYVNGVKKE